MMSQNNTKNTINNNNVNTSISKINNNLALSNINNSNNNETYGAIILNKSLKKSRTIINRAGKTRRQISNSTIRKRSVSTNNTNSTIKRFKVINKKTARNTLLSAFYKKFIENYNISLSDSFNPDNELKPEEYITAILKYVFRFLLNLL
jgi:hypothetical protein